MRVTIESRLLSQPQTALRRRPELALVHLDAQDENDALSQYAASLDGYVMEVAKPCPRAESIATIRTPGGTYLLRAYEDADLRPYVDTAPQFVRA